MSTDISKKNEGVLFFREILEKENLEQQQLAVKLGISKGYMSEILSEKKEPSEKLVKLARALFPPKPKVDPIREGFLKDCDDLTDDEVLEAWRVIRRMKNSRSDKQE